MTTQSRWWVSQRRRATKKVPQLNVFINANTHNTRAALPHILEQKLKTLLQKAMAPHGASTAVTASIQHYGKSRPVRILHGLACCSDLCSALTDTTKSLNLNSHIWKQSHSFAWSTHFSGGSLKLYGRLSRVNNHVHQYPPETLGKERWVSAPTL